MTGKTISLLFSILLSSLFTGYSQRSKIDLSKKNAAKISLIPSVVGTISLGYERFIFDNQSVNVFGGLRLTNDVPKLFSPKFVDSVTVSTTADYWSVGVAYRWYIDNCGEKLPTGLYVSPYFKYNDYKFEHSIKKDPSSFGIDIGIREVGIGVQVGYLWRFHKNFAVDFLFFGPRTGLYRIRYRINEDLSPDDQEVIDEALDGLNNFMRPLGLSNPALEMEGQTNIEVTNRSSWWGLRYAISFVVTF